MRDLCTVPRACQTAGALSHACFHSLLGVRCQDRITDQRSWTVKIVPVLSPYSSRPSCDGWDVHQVGRPSHAPSTAVWRAWGRQEKEKPPAEAVQGHNVKVNFPWCDIHTASTSFEDERLQRLMAACERRHRASSAEITTMEVQYPTCSRESIYYHTTRSLLRTQRTTTNF